jgi:hypothetical protein
VWAAVPLAAIVGWIVVSTTRTRAGARSTTDDQIATAIAASAETNRKLAERVEQIDKRLASIEKTLNDIPG